MRIDIIDKLAVPGSLHPWLGCQVEEGRVRPGAGPQDVHLCLQDVAGSLIFNLNIAFLYKLKIWRGLAGFLFVYLLKK